MSVSAFSDFFCLFIGWVWWMDCNHSNRHRDPRAVIHWLLIGWRESMMTEYKERIQKQTNLTNLASHR